jgi:hypothetical protein
MVKKHHEKSVGSSSVSLECNDLRVDLVASLLAPDKVIHTSGQSF